VTRLTELRPYSIQAAQRLKEEGAGVVRYRGGEWGVEAAAGLKRGNTEGEEG
jgi:hypothetical protein